jgi:hypothetical protein
MKILPVESDLAGGRKYFCAPLKLFCENPCNSTGLRPPSKNTR